MRNQTSAFLAAAAGFLLTVAVQLPPILEHRAEVAEAAEQAEAEIAEPTVSLDEESVARFSQLLRQHS